MRILARVVWKLTFSESWRLKAWKICWTFIQEKLLNLHKYSKLCGVLSPPFFNPHIPILSSTVTFHSLQLVVAVKNSSLEVTRGDRMGLEVPQSPSSRELSLFELYGSSLKISILRTSLFALAQSSLCAPSLEYLYIYKKKN